MELAQIISSAVSGLLQRLMWRALAFIVLMVFMLAAIYQLYAAAALQLESLYGLLYARLALAGASLVVALLIFGGLYATRSKLLAARHKPARGTASRDERMAMLLESILLGVTAARGKSR
jgi:hypothetical protein